jgi:hypothetical protein
LCIRCGSVFFVCLLPLLAADPDTQSAQAKLDSIADSKVKPGGVILFPPREVEAWIRSTIPEYVPEGIRDEHIELGTDTATASAIVDFVKMRLSQGKPTNSVLGALIEGERQLTVSVRLESNEGRCTVYLKRVDLGGVAVEGVLLEFLVKTFFLPLFPDAKINEPFDLGYNMERIELRPAGIRVLIKR